MGILGSAAAAGAGGLLNYFATEKANQANAKQASKNRDLQREAAMHGLSWRVADAKAAGLHPLIGAGAQPTMLTGAQSADVPNTAIGDAVTSMGQDLSRASNMRKTQADLEYEQLTRSLALERARLQNDLLDTQISRLRSEPGDPARVSGDGNVEVRPSSIYSTTPGQPNVQAGAISDLQLQRTGTGYGYVPSQQAKERMEDSLLLEGEWYWRNRIRPWIGASPPPGAKPPSEPLPPGMEWAWDKRNSEWRPRRRPEQHKPSHIKQEWRYRP